KALKNEERIISEAKEEASAIIEQARKEAELEKQKASDDVKKEIIRVATLMAGKMVSVSMDDATQAKLIEDTLGEIGDSTWLS
ncbi:MAG: ATP synthase F0 subunit B, partial [Lachnospiraceae bacterium]|nr:ATP synthase F0 subunit B [Lachnospiraceae bacterium]